MACCAQAPPQLSRFASVSAAMHDKNMTYSEPSEVEAVDGDVKVEGPDDVRVMLTAEAAEETSERLLTGAFKARGQTRLRSNPHQPRR
jgi:hypothetical protein